MSCGGGSAGSGANNGGGTGSPGPGTPSPIQHVAIVVFENQNYLDVIGSNAMPHLNDLIQANALATEFYANVHPSIGNYFMMTTGQMVNRDDSFPGTFDGDNVATALSAAAKTWRVYAESLPAVGYIDGDKYPYIKHHNPFVYFTNVRNDPSQHENIVPLPQLVSDINSKALPNYLFVVPNNLHNGHDCPSGGSNCTLFDRLNAADTWLQVNLGPLLSDSEFANDGVLIVTFDESATDNTNGGGRVATILAGSRVKSGFQSSATYQFPSLLRFTLKALGVTTYPGLAAQADDMDEFLK
jgi:acid phosphatase